VRVPAGVASGCRGRSRPDRRRATESAVHRYREEDFVQVPRVARSRAPAPKLIGVLLAKFPTPLPDGLIGDDDATNKEQRFDIPVAAAEPETEPHTVADALGREAMMLRAVGGWCVHATSMSPHASTGQVALNKLTMPS
jgi:hypothetical protein